MDRADIIERLETQVLYERAKCASSYYFFFKRAWEVLEPQNPLILNWHIKYLCDIIQKETIRIAERREKDRDYIINISPRSLKSKLFNVCWCPWAWTQWPWLKFINSSYIDKISTDLCLESRRLIDSDWYQKLWGHIFTLTTDQNTKGHYDNDMKGMRRSASTRGGIYGAGADIILNDDPQDPLMADSEQEREVVKTHYGKGLYTRLNNQMIGLRVIIQQRLHEEDLTGYLLTNNPEKYKHICIPGELTEDIKPKALSKYYVDGLFFPNHPSFKQASLIEAKLPTNLGEYGYSSQILQRPSPAEGGMFKRVSWRFWGYAGTEYIPPKFKNEHGEYVESRMVVLPDSFDSVIDSWDTAFEGETTSDDVAGIKVALSGANKYILGRRKGKYDFKKTKEEIVSFRESNKLTSAVIIEKSANGPAIKSDLENSIPGIIMIATGKLSKEDRANILGNTPYSAQVAAGNIYLPHPNIAPWAFDFIEEHAKFPKGAQDGQVDAAGQAVNYLTTAKMVWGYYNNADPDIYTNFSTRWTRPMLNYGLVFMSEDASSSLLCAAWDPEFGKLYVYDEAWNIRISASELVAKLRIKLMTDMFRCNGVICNSEMIDMDVKSAARLINTEAANMKVEFYAREAYQYDPLGSISLTNLMFSRDQIIVHTRCKDANRQFSSWHSNDGKPIKKNYELCQCLCLVVSELNRQGAVKITDRKPPDYKHVVNESGQPVKEADKLNAWQKR